MSEINWWGVETYGDSTPQLTLVFFCCEGTGWDRGGFLVGLLLAVWKYLFSDLCLTHIRGEERMKKKYKTPGINNCWGMRDVRLDGEKHWIDDFRLDVLTAQLEAISPKCQQGTQEELQK